VIETERLVLRRFTEDDRDAVARWNADPDFTRHLAGVQTREQSDEHSTAGRGTGTSAASACLRSSGRRPAS
jgi:RimJ/RimL family protein N-acetyltransferase